MSLPPDGYQHVGRAARRRCVAATEPEISHRSRRRRHPAVYDRGRRRADDRRRRPSNTSIPPTPDCWPSASSTRATSRRSRAPKVTIHAMANEDIQSAYVDFDCDDKLDQRMQSDKAQARRRRSRRRSSPIARRPSTAVYQLVVQERGGPAESAAGAAPDRSDARRRAGNSIRRAQEGRDRSAAQWRGGFGDRGQRSRFCACAA